MSVLPDKHHTVLHHMDDENDMKGEEATSRAANGRASQRLGALKYLLLKNILSPCRDICGKHCGLDLAHHLYSDQVVTDVSGYNNAYALPDHIGRLSPSIPRSNRIRAVEYTRCSHPNVDI